MDLAVKRIMKALLNDPGTWHAICDPGLPLEAALQVIERFRSFEPLIEVRLAKWCLDYVESPGREQNRVHRAMTLIQRTANGERILPLIVQFLHSHESWLRSKAIMLFMRASKNWKAMAKHFGDADFRVRANAIEMLWDKEEDPGLLRSVLLEAAGDSNNRVVGNALLGLYRHGDTDLAAERLRAMAVHEKAEFRATAAWVMGQTGEPGFTDILARLSCDAEESVRTNADRALKLVGTLVGSAEVH